MTSHPTSARRMVGRVRLGRLLTAGTLILGGCDPGVAVMVDDGTALAQVRTQVDGHTQCAPLIAGTWPIELGGDLLRTDSVQALVAVGLIRLTPGDAGRTRVVPTALGQRSMRLVGGHLPMLCFGRMRVTRVEAAGDRNGSGHVTYRYRLTGMPAWTRRPDIRAVFPFLAAMSGRELTSPVAAFVRDGQLRLSDAPDYALPVEFALAHFDTCSLPPNDRGLRCR